MKTLPLFISAVFVAFLTFSSQAFAQSPTDVPGNSSNRQDDKDAKATTTPTPATTSGPQGTSPQADSEGKALVPPEQTGGSNQLFFGQNHYYSLTFRGNTETVVYAKLVLNNPEETNQTDLTFEIPKVEPYELVAFQQLLPPNCVRYDYSNPQKPQVCAEYQDPDYNQGYYYGEGKTTYHKLALEKDGNSYKVKLNKPVPSYKSGAVILSYAAKGYVNETSGLFKYHFETIKVNQRIQKLQVAVDVDSDLYLRGKKSEVNYKSGEMDSLNVGSTAAGVSSPAMDRAVSQIGTYGAIVKEANNLAPNETFIVKGDYAKNMWRLYLAPILWTIGIIVGVIVLMLVAKRMMKKRHVEHANGEEVTTHASTGPQPHQPALSLKNVLLSVLSVGLVLLLTFVLSNFQKLVDQGMFPGFYSYSSPFIWIIYVIVLLLLYGLAILGPAIYGAIRGSWHSFLFIMVMQLGWFLLLGICFMLFFQSGLVSNPPGIYPMKGMGVAEPAMQRGIDNNTGAAQEALPADTSSVKGETTSQDLEEVESNLR